jgi:hypothetical protein
MSGTMLVLFASSTRHVLSAVTFTVRPKTLLTVAGLVGTSLRIRDVTISLANWHLDIPIGEVDMAEVDFDDQILVNPFLYELASNGKPQQFSRSAPSIALSLPNTISLTISSPTLADAGLNTLVCEENAASTIARVQPIVTDGSGVASVHSTMSTPRTVLGLITGFPPVVATL